MNVSVWGNVDEVVEEMKYLASPCHRSRMENLRMKVDRGMPWVKREERKAKDKGRVRVSWGFGTANWMWNHVGNQDYSNFPSAVSCDLSQLCGALTANQILCRTL